MVTRRDITDKYIILRKYYKTNKNNKVLINNNLKYSPTQVLIDYNNMLQIYLSELNKYIDYIDILIVVYIQIGFIIDYKDVYKDIKDGIMATKKLFDKAMNSLRKYSVNKDIYKLCNDIAQEYLRKYQYKYIYLKKMEDKFKYYHKLLHEE